MKHHQIAPTTITARSFIRSRIIKPLLLATLLLAALNSARAELKLPAIISDHMVLQQKQANSIWGWDMPGSKVTVTFAGQTKTATASADGKWTVTLDPLPANDQPQTLAITGTDARKIEDVLVGEVWMCSGQSNMRLTLDRDWNGDIEAAASSFPKMRLMLIPNQGSQKLLTDGKGEWTPVTPETAATFSAVGFYFGRYLHEILKVPVGLIDNSWGGSSAEAWVRRESLENDPRFKPLMDDVVKQEAYSASEKARTDYATAIKVWEDQMEQAKAQQTKLPRQPQSPHTWLASNQRPGNIFGGVLHPTLGYGIKGVIWYQGEANNKRAHEYAQLFPFMIEQWRKEWKQGEFPFYWVQLPDYGRENREPQESSWAELRAAQTATMKLPNTGQAVTIDLGEGKDIHPRNKYAVAARLVRWALARDYGMKIPYRSPEFRSLNINGSKVLVTFDCFGSRLRPFEVAEAIGFTVCGPDKVWHRANGKISSTNQVEVWSEEVTQPVAIRYAWEHNPVCNLFSNDGLPVTPFRTDDFPTTDQRKPDTNP